MDGQQETKKERKRIQRERLIRESSMEDGHGFPFKVTQQLQRPFSQNDKQSQQTAIPKQSPMMAEVVRDPQQNQQIQPIDLSGHEQEPLPSCLPQQRQASNSKGVLEYNIQQFPDTGKSNQRSIGQQLLHQPLQIRESQHNLDHLQILRQVAHNQQRNKDAVQANKQVVHPQQWEDELQPKGIVSFHSTYTDIYKCYLNSVPHQQGEHVDLRDSTENEEDNQQCVLLQPQIRKHAETETNTYEFHSEPSSQNDKRIVVCSDEAHIALNTPGKRQQQARRPLGQSAKRQCSQTVDDIRRALSMQPHSWHVNGVTDQVVYQISSEAYHTPSIMSSSSIQKLFGRKEFIMLQKTENVNPKEPISNCCYELDHNLSPNWNSTEGLVTYRSDFNQPIHSQASSKLVNWTNGVESQSHKCVFLSTANTDAKNYTLDKSGIMVLDCRCTPAEYLPMDLSKPPSDWKEPFRQIKIIADAMPRIAAEYHQKGLIRIPVRKTLVLGCVSRAEETQGLMARMSYSFFPTDFERILDMHTKMQKHAFVPRVYAMHMCVSPLGNEKCSAVFLGESPGSWNLGNAGGLLYSKREECQVTAYHVTLCLIRIQILMYMLFGFTLRIIQPARLYRHGLGFRPDMISCLIDSMHPKIHSDQREDSVNLWMREQRAKEGICAIRETLVKLGMRAYLPQEAKTLILNIENWVRYGDNLQGLHDDMSLLIHFYRLCFGEPGQLESFSFLGQQRDYKSHTINSTTGPVEPYGPFAFEIMHKPYAWNQVVIVEPKTHVKELAKAITMTPHVKISKDEQTESNREHHNNSVGPSSSCSPASNSGTGEKSSDNSAHRSMYTLHWGNPQ